MVKSEFWLGSGYSVTLCSTPTTKFGPDAYGKAGVGKLTVVEEIKRVLTAKGEKCQIVCLSAGISCACAYHGMRTSVIPIEFPCNMNYKARK